MNKQPRAELSALEVRLGYRFRDSGLAILALTHLSAQNSGGQGRSTYHGRILGTGCWAWRCEPALSGFPRRAGNVDAVR
jgi:hypothetical protein